MINKIKSILNILSNNIEKYNVEVWKYNDLLPVDNEKTTYTEWQIQFIKYNKQYSFSLLEKSNKYSLTFVIFDHSLKFRLGKPIEIEVPSNEVSEIKLLFDKVIFSSEKFVEKELENLEL